MENIRLAYNAWSAQYDSNHNRTRDLEATVLRQVLGGQQFQTCLEIGCGTGKNTSWLVTKAEEVVAVDFSEEMLAIARHKVQNPKVRFVQADITKPWDFVQKPVNLISCSLVLEHIEDLDAIFSTVSASLVSGGLVYLGELHPFKQYAGTKARFDTENGRHELTCFTHHITDFVEAAQAHGLELRSIKEFFDGDDKMGIPRILSIIFQKMD